MLFTIILYNIFNNSINNNEVTTFVVVDRERGQVVVLGLNLSATNLQEIRKIITKERGVTHNHGDRILCTCVRELKPLD